MNYSHSTGYAQVYVDDDETVAEIRYSNGKVEGPYKIYQSQWHYDGSLTFEVLVPGWFGMNKVVDYGS